MPGYWGIRIAAAVYIVSSFYLGMQALEFPAGGGTFPLFAQTCAVLISGILIVGSFRSGAREANDRIDFRLTYARAKPLLLLAVSVLYVLVIFELGYFVSTFLFLFLASWLIGIRDLKTVTITAVILIPVMYGFFVVFLQAPLPKGILF
ncbi:MAG: tripartite tricarboxylate transporter TctB family protein [Alphaproteobacteria bacterium]|nr:tripartite tricarboxylate transporter TctB family protein [Alphaproteobacteria bacterium]